MSGDVFDEHVRRDRWIERTRWVGTGILVLLALLTALAAAALWKFARWQEQSELVLTRTTALLGVSRDMEGHLKKIAGAFPLPTSRPTMTLFFDATRSFASGEFRRCDDPQDPKRVVDCAAGSWGWKSLSPDVGDFAELRKTLSGYQAITVFVMAGHDDERMSKVTAGRYDSNFNLAFRRGETVRDQLHEPFGDLVAHVRWVIVPQGAVGPAPPRIASTESRRAARMPRFVVVAG